MKPNKKQRAMKRIVIFHEKNGKKTFYTYNKTFYEIVLEVCGITETDEDGNELPNKDWMVFGNDGKMILKGLNNICLIFGILDLGNEKYIVKDITSCDEEEINLIVNEFLENKFDLSFDYKIVDFFQEYNFITIPNHLNNEEEKFFNNLLYGEFLFSSINGVVERSENKPSKKYLLIRDFLQEGAIEYRKSDKYFKEHANVLGFYKNKLMPRRIYKIGEIVICFDEDNINLG